MFIPNRKEESQLRYNRFLVASLCRNDTEKKLCPNNSGLCQNRNTLSKCPVIPNRKEESQLCHIRFLVALLCRNDKMIVNLYFETASGGGSSAEGPWVFAEGFGRVLYQKNYRNGNNYRLFSVILHPK